MYNLELISSVLLGDYGTICDKLYTFILYFVS